MHTRQRVFRLEDWMNMSELFEYVSGLAMAAKAASRCLGSAPDEARCAAVRGMAVVQNILDKVVILQKVFYLAIHLFCIHVTIIFHYDG